jgi:hypothetical protein
VTVDAGLSKNQPGVLKLTAEELIFEGPGGGPSDKWPLSDIDVPEKYHADSFTVWTMHDTHQP